MKTIAWTLFWTLLTASVGVWAYNMGTMSPQVIDTRLRGLHEVKCDDINGKRNFYTGKIDTVCEVNMTTEDENIHIYKGEGAIDDANN